MGSGKKFYCTADLNKTGAARSAAENAKEVVAQYAGRDDYHKLKAYADWISDEVAYDHTAAGTSGYVDDYIDPWQMIYVFDGDAATKVVCEGYSKAFQYLCDLSVFQGDVTCYRVWGSAGGGHMWNTVNIGGAVYLVDVTNYDKLPHWDWLFMAGAEQNADGSYTVKGTTTITYTYDSEMYQIYDPEEALELAKVKYDPNHQHSWPEVPTRKTEATCTDSGEAVFTCAACGQEKKETLPALGHALELRNEKAATCTETGYSGDTVCTRCGKTTKTGQETRVIPHTLVKQGAVAATCTQPGKLDDSYCTSCKQVIQEGKPVKALGHNIQKSGAKAATCTEDGNEVNEICTRCDYIKPGKVIPKLGHTEVLRNQKDAVCGVDGYTGDSVCTRCQETVTEGRIIPALEHQPELRGVREPSCTEEGYTGDQICKLCGDVVEKGGTISALGHDIQKSGKKDPTCTEDGNEDNETCSRCDYRKPGERIPMLGHELQYGEKIDATCTTDGKKADEACLRCGYQKAGDVIPAFGHREALQGEKEASCTEDGYTGDVVCAVCEETLKYGEVIPMHHTMDYRRIPGKEPTDTEYGERTYAQPYCAACQKPWIMEDGQEMSEEQIQAFWEENVVVYAPTRSVAIVMEDGGKVPTVAAKGGGMTLSAVVTPAAAEQRVTWSSSAPGVMEVDENGHLTFLKNGKAVISATTEDKHSAKVTIQVTTLAQKVTVSSKTGSNEVGAGKTLALAAVVEPEDTVNKKVIWSVVSGSEYAQVSAAGVVSAKKVLPEGDGLVTVRTAAVDGSGVSGEFQVQVLPLAASVVIQEGTSGKLDMREGTTISLTAKTMPETASDKVVWSSSSTKIAAVDENGVVTAVKPGTVTITAKTADGSNRSAKYTLTVTASVKEIELLGNASLAAGKSMKLTAVFTPAFASNQKLNWSVDDPKAATISTSGVLKANRVEQPVDVTVTAESQENPAAVATAVVTIYPAAITQIAMILDGMSFGGTTLVIPNGEDTHVLGTKITPDYASQDVNWNDENPAVLGLEPVADGVRLVPLAAGTSVLTAMAQDGSGKKVTLKVTVTQPMTGLALPETAAVAGGKNLTLVPAMEPADTTDKRLVWEVSPNTVGATISNGVLKTKPVQSPTPVTVTARAMDGSNVSASCTVAIYPVTASLEIRKDDIKVTALTLGTGESETVTAFAKPENLTYGKVTWTSNKASAATVNEEGTITAIAPGKAVITAAAADGSGKKVSLTVTVVQKMESLSLSGGTVVAVGRSLTLVPAIAPAGTTNKKLNWSVDDPTAATISASGVLKAKAVKEPTEVTVTAAAADGSGVEASFPVTIYPAVTKLSLAWNGSPVGSSLTCYADQLLKLDAIADPTGAYQKVIWSTSSAKTAVVNADGVVIPLKPGTVTITAAAADGTGKKASVKIIILAPAE